MIVQLQGLLATIGILDIIDIVVVAYFLYRVYLMLKNTRAATLVKGLLVLVGFMIICRAVNLHVISWLLEKSMTVIMVALPVVFQPELRRALEQIGRGKLFRKGSELDEQELNAMLDDVANATKAMSASKVGALMVFERATGLVERIETGVPIDGVVSSGLIQNIFVKDTPLHDGAVIIRGNRIVAACCLLPLTENRNLSQELGTRHRAALGMSEQSDAMVLVVSEETGAISIARNGELMRYLTVEDVKAILRNAIIQPHAAVKDNLVDKIKGMLGGEKK
ncbi:MAG: diadenylate cyclase CdaA [Phascolarctobacterium sp.]|nr:diadenylate cyclase CdaA [Phascolarctobacterium sp.]